MAFSWRAFAAGILLTSVSRNIDNLLVGKYQGPEALAFYGLAYRLLLLPVQLLSMTVGGVLFPAFSRKAEDLAAIRSELTRTTRTLAALVLPAMALVAAAAPQLVAILFGEAWEPAVPIVQVLAMVGAVQAIYQPSTMPLVLGLGHAGLNLRYALLTTAVSTAGFVAGLPFGPLGVAVGYAAATAALVPVEWIIRRRLLGMTMSSQARTLVPGFHLAVWVALTYTLVAVSLGRHDVVALAAGTLLAIAVGLGVMRVVHRSQLSELVDLANRVFGRGTQRGGRRRDRKGVVTATRRPHRRRVACGSPKTPSR